MLNNLSQLKYIIISVIIFNFVWLGNFDENQLTQAQTEDNKFNKQKCVSELVTKGLKEKEATGWCEYQQECLTQAQGEGLPLEVAESLCDCTLGEFRNHYTLTKFQELNQQAKNNPDINQQLTEVGEVCFEDILFAE